ncbi:hypothetical protein ABMC88_11080 [Sulfitobacter sp. HNIBRBA2951]|uniref:hypothetical protein n=1 Tax=Sulfitobacter aquimarinus TaxID=3158557 RepID=UPI0032DE3D8D
MLYILVPGLALWMFGCAYAGYFRRFKLFLGIVLVGMALNATWMILGLDAKLLSPPALAAHAGALIYAICAFVAGWLAGRIMRRFRDSRVEPS